MKRLLLGVCTFGLLLSSASAQEEPSKPAPNPELVVEPPQGQITSQNSSARAAWRSQIMEVLERNKRYPESVSRGEHGTAQVFFTLDRQGHLIYSRVVHSSGVSALDEEALALLQRAQPFPPPPPEVPGKQVDLSVPIQFNKMVVSGLEKYDITRHVSSGKKRNIAFYTSVTPECSVIDGTEIKKTQGPEHGTVDIAPEQGFGFWSKDTVRYKCNDKKIRGLSLYYKSFEGYRGSDKFDLLILWPNGTAREEHYDINVR